ncbi:MAG: hypothetical protein A2X84_13405 [Desulfuromonadaceae bacterium GWC2_58_13]|nr:MAG: hypothetical protein A2X84_13405 [Desulfuromonadaceae bacterium GWC2_58_13]
MKTTTRIAAATATLMTLATSAFASGGRVDNSGIVVWIFLGFCGMIVAAQMIPALLVMFGLAKGVMAPREEATQETGK